MVSFSIKPPQMKELLLKCDLFFVDEGEPPIERIPFGLRVFDLPLIVVGWFSPKIETFSRRFFGSLTNGWIMNVRFSYSSRRFAGPFFDFYYWDVKTKSKLSIQTEFAVWLFLFVFVLGLSRCMAMRAFVRCKLRRHFLAALGLASLKLILTFFANAILPTAHTMKSMDSKFVMEASQVRTKRRIGLTGTPYQNNRDELRVSMPSRIPMTVA